MKAKWEQLSEEELRNIYENSKTLTEFCLKIGYSARNDTISKPIKEKYKQYKGFTHYKDLTNKKIGLLTVIEKTDKRSPQGNVVWKCQCKCGNYCEITSDHLNSKNPQLSCGCLRYSYYEHLIETILKKNHYNFEKEYSFSDLMGDSAPLRFDFIVYLKNIFILIEYNGEQHYSTKFYDGEKRLALQQKYDSFKKDYCAKHNFPLIIIPYWDKNKINDEYINKLIMEVLNEYTK